MLLLCCGCILYSGGYLQTCDFGFSSEAAVCPYIACMDVHCLNLYSYRPLLIVYMYSSWLIAWIPTPSVSRTAMSPDTDSLFASGPLPLSPLALSNQISPSSYYSASDADFATLYHLPAQPPFNSSSLELYSSSNEDINLPVFSKMVDPRGGTCELLSLSDISNSELGYEDYLCSGGMFFNHGIFRFVIYNVLFLPPTVNNGLDQDWLVSLPSPEEQDTDVKLPLVPPPATPQTLSFQFWPTPAVTLTSSALLTPDPSLPGSPSSTHSYSSEEEEVKEVLSFFDDGESNRDVAAAAVQPFAPNMVMLPVISPPQILDVQSPTSSCSILSPSPSLQDSEDSCDGLLDRRESSASLPSLMSSPTAHMKNGSMEKSRKRKSLPISSSDNQSCAPSPAVKRRLSKSAKKERKKEQNKTAALRYRQKKKEEKDGIELRRIELEEKNQDLKAQVNSLSNEINYLKKLWLEVCANKKRSAVSKLS